MPQVPLLSKYNLPKLQSINLQYVQNGMRRLSLGQFFCGGGAHRSQNQLTSLTSLLFLGGLSEPLKSHSTDVQLLILHVKPNHKLTVSGFLIKSV